MPLTATMRSNNGTMYTYISRTLSCDEFVNAVDYFYLHDDVEVDLINDAEIEAFIELRPNYTYFIDLIPGSIMPSITLARNGDRA